MSARLGKYVQTDEERKRYTLDYSDWLDPGEVVSTTVFVITPATDPLLMVDGITMDPTRVMVQYYVSGGKTGVTYEVTPKIATSLNQIKEDVVVVSIREP